MWARFDLSGPAIHHLFTGTGVLANFRRTSGQLAARGSPGSAAGSLLELLGQKPQNGACTPRRATNKSPALGGGDGAEKSERIQLKRRIPRSDAETSAMAALLAADQLPAPPPLRKALHTIDIYLTETIDQARLLPKTA
jgi:hypothetical protein